MLFNWKRKYLYTVYFMHEEVKLFREMLFVWPGHLLPSHSQSFFTLPWLLRGPLEVLNSFLANVPILYSPPQKKKQNKTNQNLLFLRGYKMKTSTRNELNPFPTFLQCFQQRRIKYYFFVKTSLIDILQGRLNPLSASPRNGQIHSNNLLATVYKLFEFLLDHFVGLAL